MQENQNQDPTNSTAPENGKQDDNSKGNQGDENIKALQQKLTLKDQEYKKLSQELETLRKTDEKKKEVDKTEQQKVQEGYEKMALQLEEMKMASDYKEVKKDFPKFAESIIKLLIKDRKGNLEEVKEALRGQSKLLGLKSISTPKFEPEKAEKIIEKIKKDSTLAPEVALAKIREIRKNIK